MKIGIDLGGSHIAIGLVNGRGEILDSTTYYIRQEHKEYIEQYITNCIGEGIKNILKEQNIPLEQIELIGIATPGNPKDGYIRNVVNLSINEFNIKKCVKQKIEELFLINELLIPIHLKNDGKCAGLAEKIYGRLKDYEDCVFLCIGTGIGGAAFLQGKFLEPKRNSGFEFGHMVIQKKGKKCNCGNEGCFETYGSLKRWKAKLKDILVIEEDLHSQEMMKLIEENKENLELQQAIEEYIEDLAIGICNIINILEPEAISLGGSFSHYAPLLYERLRKKIESGKYLFNKEETADIVIAHFQNDAGMIGATLI